jgi:hypothetical protein
MSKIERKKHLMKLGRTIFENNNGNGSLPPMIISWYDNPSKIDKRPVTGKRLIALFI